jgi:enoyl-CoA hydratase
MAYQNLLVEVSDKIATVTINRPKSLNALNRATIQELSKALEEFARDAEVGVVLITGAGEKSFVAGADISEMREFASVQALEFALFGQGVLGFIEQMPQPVIGVINGYALGGGCELAMACDILVAAENARFGQPEVSLGILPGYGGTQRLPRLIGRNLAKELVLTGEMIPAQRAYEIGLVNRVVPQADLITTARGIAEDTFQRSRRRETGEDGDEPRPGHGPRERLRSRGERVRGGFLDGRPSGGDDRVSREKGSQISGKINVLPVLEISRGER